MIRTVDGPLLNVVTKAYHLHVFLSLSSLNIQTSLKHSNTRLRKAQMSTRAPCSVCTQRATSHRQQDRTELSSCIRTNKYKSQFKHAHRKKCESTQISTRGVLCTQRSRRDVSQSAWTPNLPFLALVPTNTLSKYPSWRVSSKLSVMS